MTRGGVAKDADDPPLDVEVPAAILTVCINGLVATVVFIMLNSTLPA